MTDRYPELVDDRLDVEASPARWVGAWRTYLEDLDVPHYPATPIMALLAGECVYCGSEAEHLDHVLPAPWTGSAMRMRTPMVPSCARCNRALSSHIFPDLLARREYVAARAVARYRKRYPSSPVATLDGTTGKLRGRLVSMMARRLDDVQRLVALGQHQYRTTLDEICHAAGSAATPRPEPSWVRRHGDILSPSMWIDLGADL